MQMDENKWKTFFKNKLKVIHIIRHSYKFLSVGGGHLVIHEYPSQKRGYCLLKTFHAKLVQLCQPFALHIMHSCCCGLIQVMCSIPLHQAMGIPKMNEPWECLSPMSITQQHTAQGKPYHKPKQMQKAGGVVGI